MKENADKARGLDTAEIHKQLRDGDEQMFRLRFQMSMGQMEGFKKLRQIKKDRARMLTVLRERELHPEAAPKAKTTVSVPAVAKAAASAKAKAPAKKSKVPAKVTPVPAKKAKAPAKRSVAPATRTKAQPRKTESRKGKG